MHSCSIALATSTLSSFSPCTLNWSTSNIYCFFILLKAQRLYLSYFPFSLHFSHFHSQVKKKGGGDHLRIYFLVTFLFCCSNFSLMDDLSDTWICTGCPCSHFLLTFSPLLSCLLPFDHRFSFPSISRLCSKTSSTAALHAEILCERREPRRHWGWAWGWAWGYRRRRWGQYQGQVRCGGDDLLLAVPRYFLTFASHRLLNCLHWILGGKNKLINKLNASLTTFYNNVQNQSNKHTCPQTETLRSQILQASLHNVLL